MQTEEKILDKVRKMLNLADNPGATDEERAAFIEKADHLMVKYAIDAAMLEAEMTPEERRRPVSETFEAYSSWTTWDTKFRTILVQLGKGCRIRAANTGYWGTLSIVGFQEDISYFKMLWTTIYLDFLSKLDPKWNVNFGDDENIYNFVRSGKKWEYIAEICRDHDINMPWPDGGRLKRAYHRHQKKIGEPPRSHTGRHEAYRESFAEGFTMEICRRLSNLREEAEEQVKSSGAEIVLWRAQEDVDALFYELHPELSPEARRARLAKYEEEAAAARAAEERRRAALTPRQRLAEDRKRERDREIQMRKDARYWNSAQRNVEAARRYDPTGLRVGEAAARDVDLAPKTGVYTGTREELE
jgi:hypothetical protein